MSAGKVKPLPELSKVIARLKERGKKVVHCHGVYDLVHLGHIRHLKAAKKEGDVLVVTITKDKFVKRGPGRPIFNEHLRAENLAALEVVDFVASVESPTAVEAIHAIKPDAYVKGQDYKNREKDVTGMIYEEEAAVKKHGGKIVFTDEVTFSSSVLINRYLEVYPDHTVKYLKQLSKKYGIDGVIDRLSALKKKKVLVIGDAIIDRYRYCRPMAKSSKEPIVVQRYLSEEDFAGGVLATANHVSQLVQSPQLVTALGKQLSHEAFIRKHLTPGVRPKFFFQKDSSTIVKTRYVSEENHQKFFEVCYMNQPELSPGEKNQIHAYLKRNLEKFDVVIVNDFGHGLLSPDLIQLICKKSKYLALNVQTNSANLGFNMITKYPRADYICIDENEMRLATHDRQSDLKSLILDISRQTRCPRVTVTRGKDGSLSYSKKEWFHPAPAFSYQVIDKVGAGDAFFAFTAPCAAADMPLDLTSFIGNTVGSLAVQIVGNREPVRFDNLVKFVTRLLKF